MKEFHLNSVDLNLLLVFNRIYARQNLTQAAEDLGRTQSALSHSLERLRQLFNDPLFVRLSKKMKPTKRADSLAGPIQEAINAIDKVFSVSDAFSAKHLKRSFTLSMSDYCQTVILPPLLKYLNKQAPFVDIRVLTSTDSELQKNLESGLFDTVIGNKDLGAGIMQQQLYEDEFVCMVNSKHPLVAEGITLQEFTEYSHILFTTKGKGDRLIEQTLKKKKIKRKIAARVPNILVIPRIILNAPYIVTLPLKLAKAVEHNRLKILAPPLSLPKLRIFQYWHSTCQNDPAHLWLRKSLQSLFSD